MIAPTSTTTAFTEIAEMLNLHATPAVVSANAGEHDIAPQDLLTSEGKIHLRDDTGHSIPLFCLNFISSLLEISRGKSFLSMFKRGIADLPP